MDIWWGVRMDMGSLEVSGDVLRGMHAHGREINIPTLSLRGNLV
jgi:hypothetical protein